MPTLSDNDIKDRLFEITGDTEDIETALDQWQQERQAMSELFYENEKLIKLDAKTKLVIAQAIAAINKMELDANMFIKPATRAKVETFRLMCKNLADGRDMDEI